MKQNDPVKGLSVALIDHMGDDARVAQAARVSTGSKSEQYTGLLNYLAREKHTSPFEHCTVTFMVDAPLFVHAQWMRHRTQSYNAQSFRYSGLKDLPSPDDMSNYYFGELLTERDRHAFLSKYFYFYPRNRPLTNHGSGAHPKFIDEPTEEEYSGVLSVTMRQYYEALSVYQFLKEQGIADEVARAVLPTATRSKFYTTANLKNWFDFVNTRTASNAQWEINYLAEEIRKHLYELFPISSKAWFDQDKDRVKIITPTPEQAFKEGLGG